MAFRRKRKIVPNRLREQRERCSIGLRELARHTGIDLSVLARVENQASDLRDCDKIAVFTFLSSIDRKLTFDNIFFTGRPVNAPTSQQHAESRTP